MNDKDRKPKSFDEDTKASKNKKDTATDPHRGITDTPPQKKEMMPGGEDPEEYFDDDGALDEELEDLDDEVEE